VVERVGFAEQQLQLAFDYEDKGSDGDLKAAAQAYELCLDWGAGLVELLTLHNPPVSAGSGGDKSVDSPTSLDETAVAAIGQWREFRGEAAYNLGGLLQDLGRPREESMARYQEVKSIHATSNSTQMVIMIKKNQGGRRNRMEMYLLSLSKHLQHLCQYVLCIFIY